MPNDFLSPLATKVAAMQLLVLECESIVEQRAESRAALSSRQVQTAQRVSMMLGWLVHRVAAVHDLLSNMVDSEPRDRIRKGFYGALARGDLLLSEEFQARDERSRRSIARAVEGRRVFFLEFQGLRAFPAFFVDGRYSRRDVEKVTKALGDVSPGGKYLFFTQPKVSLSNRADGTAVPAQAEAGLRSAAVGSPRLPAAGTTPLDALAAGRVDAVLRAALACAERGNGEQQ